MDGTQLVGEWVEGFKERPGAQYSRNKQGGAKVTREFSCHWKNVDKFSPAIDSQDLEFPNLLVTAVEGKRQEGGYLTYVTVTYEGLPAGNDQSQLPEPTEELSATASQEPIETHPDFKDLATPDTAIFESKKDSANTPYTVFVDFKADNELFGTKGFLAFHATYRKTYASKVKPSLIKALGVIVSGTGLPALPKPRNWLQTAFTWSKNGGYFMITEEFMASGLKGWNKKLYS